MLKDVCAINMGQSPDSNSYNDNGDGVPFFQGNADFGERYPITRKWCTAPTKMAAPNDILISVRAPIGAMNYAKESCCIGRGLAALTPDKSKVSSEFIFWLMKCKNQELNSKGTGSTFKAIGRKVLEETLVPNITLEKQTEYSAILERVYAVIQARKTELQKLDELVKARFVELFGDQKTNPFGWEQCTIGECCTLKSGTSLPSEVENEGGPIPYIKVGDMNYPGNERYITTSSRYVSESTAGKGLFEVGSILFPKRGGAIGTNKKRMTKRPVCADLNVMGVSSKGRLRPEYLLAYFDMIDLGALSDGSSVPQINNKNIAPLVICMPPLELQEQFAAFVKQTDKSKLAVQQSLVKLELLKKALMQKYFG